MPEKLSDVFANLDKYSWRDWVYLCRKNRLNNLSSCIVLDPDKAELGGDGFTPLAAERLCLEEFLSIQDLRSVRDNLFSIKPTAGVEDLCDAAIYYYEHDAFMPLQS